MGDAKRQLAQGGHLLDVNLLFTLRLVTRVSFGDHVEALSQPFAGGMLLRIREQLIRLRPNLPPLIIRQQITHLLDKYQQRPPSAFTIAASLSYPPCTFQDWF